MTFHDLPDLICPDLSQTVQTYHDIIDLSCPNVTWPDLTWLVLTCLNLFWPVPTYPNLFQPLLTCLDLSQPVVTCSDLLWPVLTFPDMFIFLSRRTKVQLFILIGLLSTRTFVLAPLGNQGAYARGKPNPTGPENRHVYLYSQLHRCFCSCLYWQ